MGSLYSICMGNCNGGPLLQVSFLFSYLMILNPETFHGFARNYGDLIGMSLPIQTH